MITLENLDTIVAMPSFSPLCFPIPDSIDGSKRRATFLKLEYFTADNLPTEVAKQSAYLKVSFHVVCYIERNVPQMPIWDPILEEDIPQPDLIEELELIGRDFYDEFTADYKTYVNALPMANDPLGISAGMIIVPPKNGAPDNDGLVQYLNQLVTDAIYTEQDILDKNTPNLLVTTQIKFFEMMFNDDSNYGMIPVKQMIQGFAMTATWKDIKVRTL